MEAEEESGVPSWWRSSSAVAAVKRESSGSSVDGDSPLSGSRPSYPKRLYIPYAYARGHITRGHTSYANVRRRINFTRKSFYFVTVLLYPSSATGEVRGTVLDSARAGSTVSVCQCLRACVRACERTCVRARVCATSE